MVTASSETAQGKAAGGGGGRTVLVGDLLANGVPVVGDDGRRVEGGEDSFGGAERHGSPEGEHCPCRAMYRRLGATMILQVREAGEKRKKGPDGREFLVKAPIGGIYVLFSIPPGPIAQSAGPRLPPRLPATTGLPNGDPPEGARERPGRPASGASGSKPQHCFFLPFIESLAPQPVSTTGSSQLPAHMPPRTSLTPVIARNMKRQTPPAVRSAQTAHPARLG